MKYSAIISSLVVQSSKKNFSVASFLKIIAHLTIKSNILNTDATISSVCL